jgi:hypothetical protein
VIVAAEWVVSSIVASTRTTSVETRLPPFTCTGLRGVHLLGSRPVGLRRADSGGERAHTHDLALLAAVVAFERNTIAQGLDSDPLGDEVEVCTVAGGAAHRPVDYRAVRARP